VIVTGVGAVTTVVENVSEAARPDETRTLVGMRTSSEWSVVNCTVCTVVVAVESEMLARMSVPPVTVVGRSHVRQNQTWKCQPTAILSST
jgi:precorrin-4 methylase